jgi:hypothetical protein
MLTDRHPLRVHAHYFIARQLTQHLKTNGITNTHYNSHADPTDHHEKKEEPELVDICDVSIICRSVPEHLQSSGKQDQNYNK